MFALLLRFSLYNYSNNPRHQDMILSLLLCVGAIHGLAFESDVVDYSGYQVFVLNVIAIIWKKQLCNGR